MRPAKLKHQEKTLRQAIKRARQKGDARAEDFRIFQYLHSYSSKVMAARQAKAECKRRSPKSAETIAQELDWNTPSQEPVFLTVSMRNMTSDERPRFILSFGPENQARQIMVRNAIYHSAELQSDQTFIQGGSGSAIAKIQRAYSDGFVHVTELDIRRCYKSFDGRKAGQLLRLPESVIENVLTLEHTPISFSHTCLRDQLHHYEGCHYSPGMLFRSTYGEDFSYAQQGLIEGSKASPFIAEMLLAPVCKKLQASGLGKVVNYADNFLLMARTRDERVALENILRNELRAHPVGALTVRDCIYDRGPGDAFEFLGYRLEPQLNILHVSLGQKTVKKLSDMRRKAYRELSSKMPIEKKRRVLRKLEKKHSETLRGLPCFMGRHEFHNNKMGPLKSLL